MRIVSIIHYSPLPNLALTVLFWSHDFLEVGQKPVQRRGGEEQYWYSKSDFVSPGQTSISSVVNNPHTTICGLLVDDGDDLAYIFKAYCSLQALAFYRNSLLPSVDIFNAAIETYQMVLSCHSLNYAKVCAQAFIQFSTALRNGKWSSN